jgi:gamma-glutamylcyclotransferase (GGCT)/AIG2-like uncharacterized protein YtfP
MTDSLLPLFVYGTLRPGAAAFGQVAPYVQRLVAATLAGAELYDLGPYPVLVEGDGQVVGEALYLNSSLYRFALHRLDRYEGYNAVTNSGLYVRRERDITLAGGERVAAWVYLGTRQQTVGARRIVGGDWLAWRK